MMLKHNQIYFHSPYSHLNAINKKALKHSKRHSRGIAMCGNDQECSKPYKIESFQPSQSLIHIKFQQKPNNDKI